MMHRARGAPAAAPPGRPAPPGRDIHARHHLTTSSPRGVPWLLRQLARVHGRDDAEATLPAGRPCLRPSAPCTGHRAALSWQQRFTLTVP